MPAPFYSLPLSIDVHSMSAAVRQEGYSVESQCYYKTVGGENWDSILAMDMNLEVLWSAPRKTMVGKKKVIIFFI